MHTNNLLVTEMPDLNILYRTREGNFLFASDKKRNVTCINTDNAKAGSIILHTSLNEFKLIRSQSTESSITLGTGLATVRNSEHIIL